MPYGIKEARSLRWLVSYDPNASATTPPTYPTGEATFSEDASKALSFAGPGEAYTYARQVSSAVPLRPDGMPNRPLTAFGLIIAPLPGKDDADIGGVHDKDD